MDDEIEGRVGCDFIGEDKDGQIDIKLGVWIVAIAEAFLRE